MASDSHEYSSDDEPNALPSRTPLLLSCFNRNLPALGTQNNYPCTPAKPSGTKTRYTDPPRILLYSNITKFEKVADEVLLKKRLTRALGSSHSPPIVSNQELSSKADVIGASNRCIIGVIEPVLKVLFRQPWKSNAELPQPADEERKEEISGDVRYDYVFRDQFDNKIAIIEYKMRGLIQYLDFQEALIREEAPGPQISEKIDQAMDEAELITLLEGNVKIFVKQVVAYTDRSRCEHVALFNWDHLILFEPPASETKSPGPIVPWVHEGTKVLNELAEVGHIRKVLLGFLVRAFKANGLAFDGTEGQAT